MRKILIFDTETVGLPVNWNAPHTDTYNWPRMTQFAWELATEEGERIEGRCDLVKPDGWKIPKEAFFLENNMSTERCEREGQPIFGLLIAFTEALKQASVLIAHNMSFDKKIVNAELYRYGFPAMRTEGLEYYCTKINSTNIVKIKAQRGGYKWPNLTEAYQHFFGKGFEGAHDAGFDIEACKQVYLAIKEHEFLQ